MYIIHVLLIPGILLALISAHLFFMFHQKHTQMPAKGNTERNVNGQPFYPYFMAKGGAWFFFIFGALVLLSTFAEINPIWLYGPYSPVAISSASQPDFYMGILEGSLRMMPAWEIELPRAYADAQRAHTVRAAADDRPGRGRAVAVLRAVGHRGQVVRTTSTTGRGTRRCGPAIGMAAIVFYGVLWVEGANDVIADKLQIPLYTVTWISRVLIFVGPALAYVITKRVCLGLQRKDREELLHGFESGIIRQLPDGEFIEVHQPVNEERRAVLEAKPVLALLPGARRRGRRTACPRPSSRGMLGKARAFANRAFAETIPVEADGHGNGHHGNGHAVTAGEEHEAVGAPGSAALPAGEGEEKA